MCRDTTNVEHECMILPVIIGATGIVTEKFESYTGKTFNRFAAKGRCTRNITHNTESAAV